MVPPRSAASAVRCIIQAPTRGWVMALSRARRSGSPNTISARAARSRPPAGFSTRSPNSATTARRPSVPGSTTARAPASASMTVAPSSRSISLTVLLPVPIPPVRPISLSFGTAYDVDSMAEEVDFSRERPGDAIVVGAGPAGSAAAITMARAGLQVMLIERGQKPGSKNVMGGILYNHYLEEILGEAWQQAPLERPIIREDRWIMSPDAY